MSWEGLSWLLLRACRPTSQQLITILQPLNGRFPTDAAEFDATALTLRRVGRVLERSYGNIATSLTVPPQHGFATAQAFPAGAPDWSAQPAESHPSGDPWAAPGATDPWGGTIPPNNAAYPAGMPAAASSGDAAADSSSSETASRYGECDYSGMAGYTPAQVDEELFFEYQRAKHQWRKHMGRPTRRVRSFVKRKGKGKGGKGKNRYNSLPAMPDEEYDQIFLRWKRLQ